MKKFIIVVTVSLFALMVIAGGAMAAQKVNIRISACNLSLIHI